MTWLSFLPFAVLVLFVVVATVGLWYFQVVRRAAPMRRLAARIGGRFLYGARPNLSARIPQFEGGHFRFTRVAYNVVEFVDQMDGQPFTLWVGTAAQQLMGDALQQATGGGAPAGFLAADLTRWRTPDLQIFDRSEPAGPKGDDPVSGGRAHFLNTLASMTETSGREELRTSDPDFDSTYRVLSAAPSPRGCSPPSHGRSS